MSNVKSHPNDAEQDGTGGDQDVDENTANAYKANKAPEVRRPSYKDSETTPVDEVDLSFDAFLAGFGKHNPDSDNPEVQDVSELTAEQRAWMASKSLLGDEDAESFDDLIELPVVNPDTDALNRDLLSDAKAAVPEKGYEQSTVDDVGKMVDDLYEEEFSEGEQASYNGTDEDFDWPNPNEYGDDGDNENESESAGTRASDGSDELVIESGQDEGAADKALAAGRLGGGSGDRAKPKPAEQPPQRDKQGVAVTKSTRMLPRIASRMFNTPLMVHEGKMHTLLNVVGGRTGLDMNALAELMVEGDPDTAWDQREPKPYEVTEDGVAIIPILGTLVSRGIDLNNDSGMTGYDNIRSRFEEAIEDDDVKAIAFDFDSPGGEVNGLMDLVDDIYEARGTKPMWSIVNDMAYSAAFALASATDRIVMSRSSGVGSVGVVMVHADWSAFDHMNGIKFTMLHEGKRKVDGNDMGPLTPEAREEIEAEIKRHYGMFVETVARNLGVDVEAVKATEARCYTGQKAIDQGFAHEVTRTKTAYKKIADLAKGAVAKTDDSESEGDNAPEQAKNPMSIKVEMSDELRDFQKQVKQLAERLATRPDRAQENASSEEKSLEDEVEIVDDTNSSESDEWIHMSEVESVLRKEIRKMMGRVDD